MNIIAHEYSQIDHLHERKFDTTITDQIKKSKKDFKEHTRDIMPLIYSVFEQYDTVKEHIVLQDHEANDM